MFVYLLINITFAVIIIILNTTLVIKAIRKKKSQDQNAVKKAMEITPQPFTFIRLYNYQNIQKP